MQNVGTAEVDIGFERCGVFLCHGKRSRGYVGGRDVRKLEREGKRYGYAATACAYVEHTQVGGGSVVINDYIDEHVGFWARNERGWRHTELVAVEARLAQDVLKRLVGCKTVDYARQLLRHEVGQLVGAVDNHVNWRVVHYVVENYARDGLNFMLVENAGEPCAEELYCLVGRHSGSNG